MTKKKILIGLAVLIIVVLGALGLEKYNKQKIAREKERLIAQCRDEVKGMNEAQIIGKINALPRNTPEELERVRNANASMYQYLRCRFFENPFEERFEETKGLLEATSIPAEKKARMIEDFSKYLKSAQDNREMVIKRISHPSLAFINYNIERLCPDGKEDPIIVQKLIDEAVKSGFTGTSMDKVRPALTNYCKQIIKYSKNPAALAAEVYNFKDWNENKLMRKGQYDWRVMLALRFGGQTQAVGVCNNLSDKSEKEDCLKTEDDLSGWPTSQLKKDGCVGYEFEKIKNLICAF